MYNGENFKMTPSHEQLMKPETLVIKHRVSDQPPLNTQAMKPTKNLTAPAFLLHLIEDLVLANGLNVDYLHQEILGSDTSTITVDQLELSTEWIIEKTGKPWLVLELATKTNYEHFGNFGRIIASCRDGREAIVLYQHFQSLLHPLFDIVLLEKDELVAILFREPCGVELKHWYSEAVLGAIPVWAERLTGESLTPIEIWFKHDAPEYIEKYQKHFDCTVKFSQSMDCLWIKPAVLDRPIRSASPIFNRKIIKEAEEELNKLQTISQKVKHLILACLPEDISIDQIACSLCLGARTLQRKLIGEQSTVKKLKQEVKREEALMLLKGRQLSIEQIAFKLGYEQRSSFAAAFHKWTGMSPGEWRKNHITELS